MVQQVTPSFAARLKLPKFRPLKRVGLPRRPEAIGPREGKEGEQHAENLGLMDALRGGARAHVLNENGRLLH
jgi:hypothetical protein